MPWRQCVFLFGNYQILIQTADISQPFFEERVLDRKNGIDRRVQYVYDAAGNALKRTLLGADGECLESSTRYDLKDRATHRTNPAGGVTRYLYDRNDRLRKEISPYGYEPENDDGAGAAYTYDSRGNRIRTTNALGEVVQELSYNLQNQPVIQKDTFGNWTELSYELDGKIKDVRRSGNHQRTLQQYEYNARGQITEIRDPEGVRTRYEYDILGRRSRIYNNDGLEVRYGYDALNRIRHIRYGNGVETAYTYDGDGNIRTLETRAGENVLLSFAYRYDGNGNRTAKTGMQAGVTLGGVTSEITAGNNALDISYNYDVRGQLLEERRNGASVCYAYDKAGNRIRKTDAQGEIRYLYNEKNQLVEEESPADRKQFSYDRQGGIIEEKNAAGIRRFSYNSRRQQTRVETETGNVQENRYDAEGLRFELLENGRRTSFVYHNGELLQEEGREEQKTSYHLGAGIEAFQRGQELYYYHKDEQLSTALVTDEHRNVQSSYQYDAFGIPLETTEQLNNRIRYTGQQYDELTEQYYLRARYYNPVAGRFMQEDVYQGDGLNLYAYCGNNPVVYYDPSGYASTSIGKACPPQGKISESVDESGSKTNWEAHNVVNYAKLKEQYRVSELANDVVDSITQTGALPSNYITKSQARAMGWSEGKTLNNCVPGKALGGDVFANTNGVLPSANGRIWYEADVGVDYTMSRSNSKNPAYRILYSNDGLIYGTYDHYDTVFQIFP